MWQKQSLNIPHAALSGVDYTPQTPADPILRRQFKQAALGKKSCCSGI
jgi:hypothetical protein